MSPLAEAWVPPAESAAVVRRAVERARPATPVRHQSANPEDEEDGPLDVLAAVDAEDRVQRRIMAGSDEEDE